MFKYCVYGVILMNIFVSMIWLEIMVRWSRVLLFVFFLYMRKLLLVNVVVDDLFLLMLFNFLDLYIFLLILIFVSFLVIFLILLIGGFILRECFKICFWMFVIMLFLLEMEDLRLELYLFLDFNFFSFLLKGLNFGMFVVMVGV